MALNLASSGDIITHTGDLAIPLASTVCMWFRPTSDTVRQTLFSMQTAAGIHYQIINFRADLANDPFETHRQRASTEIATTANAANFASYALNAWQFFVAIFDANGTVATDQKMMIGNLTTPPTEPSAYSTQTAGSGNGGVTVSPFHFGNNNTSTTRVFIGDIASISFFNRVLTLNEIYQVWRFNAPLSGRIVQSHYGLLGTGTQPDWSGNGRTGTVTGATVSAHVPLGPLFAWPQSDAYVVAAGGVTHRPRLLLVNQAVQRAANW